MFGFKLWAGFGSFRDPLTITQNMTLSIPPKTTMGGMLAAILGIKYDDYFADREFFNFGYSLILENPVLKKSFAQNYINDYTKISSTRLDMMLKIRDKGHNLDLFQSESEKAASSETFSEIKIKKLGTLETKIKKAKNELIKEITEWKKKTSERYSKPKPIFRELLLNPSYIVFINGFKHEDELTRLMRSHESRYPLYMGNSEFPASYRFIECLTSEMKHLAELDSFSGNPEKIAFEAGKKYTNIYAATRTIGDREYRDFRSVVICDKNIVLTEPVNGYVLGTDRGEYRCEFI
jgi:CRISPR-associated protein Cas5h